ncbi:2'-5' RNA ligase family protein [Luteimonas sp. SDU82]|uniref:2'-5' RNA ligase family protein n=1 Tax=Luteimonas sp. SDU82 TaxID=3422592 RepID=UPI003EBD21E1
MSRTLFTGWKPGVAAQATLGGLRDRIVAARPGDAPSLSLRRPDQWHITLCFVARDFDDAVVAATRNALGAAAKAVPPHEFSIERLAFWRAAGVLVALPRRNALLQALCDANRDALRDAGIRPQEATTQPHVTLAYLERGAAPQPWLDEVDCAGEPLRVDGFELLFNAGGRYQTLGEWPLRGTAPPAQQQPSLF